MSPLASQLVQSIGQFLIVFVSGMAVFKGWSEIQQAGFLNSAYQPIVQGLISALGIWGFSKVGSR